VIRTLKILYSKDPIIFGYHVLITPAGIQTVQVSAIQISRFTRFTEARRCWQGHFEVKLKGLHFSSRPDILLLRDVPGNLILSSSIETQATF